MAIKKIDNVALSLQEEDNFLEAISNMSHLRHPNIVTLAGYCAEHGQRLLVYEYVGNGSLHDILHFAKDSSKTLTWNTCVRIALGTARALEHMEEEIISGSRLVELNEHNSGHGLCFFGSRLGFGFKKLFKTNITEGNNRFSITLRQIVKVDFLSEQEKEELRARQEIPVRLINSKLQIFNDMVLIQWDMPKDTRNTSSTYALRTRWNIVQTSNDLKERDLVQL
ncbi:hypothetical protein SO802_005239 [Lithocarpus litseifolius]|uniref:Protein kinase domain-containing protein n=1 Tax=Lithocarpus litseifolius TaxID=425828 RepID=A0AAW2DN81_9ROSI